MLDPIMRNCSASCTKQTEVTNAKTKACPSCTGTRLNGDFRLTLICKSANQPSYIYHTFTVAKRKRAIWRFAELIPRWSKFQMKTHISSNFLPCRHLPISYWFKFVMLVSITTICSINPSKLSAQTICFTPETSSNSGYSEQIRAMNEDGPFYLKIYVHVIRRSDGTGGPTLEQIEQGLEFLDTDYNPHNIFFVHPCAIDYIDNDDYFEDTGDYIFEVNNHQDGIDIYLFDETATAGGKANGVGESSEFWVSGTFWLTPFGFLVPSHVMSHEMGHVINLWHTHHGVESNGCEELVDGSNCEDCGDEVCDTPADTHLNFDVDADDCEWDDTDFDSNGDQLNPNTHLIMSYTHMDCMEYFTEGQGQRMRNSIAALQFLQDCLVTELTITENTTWDSDTQVLETVEVLSGVTLTITAEIQFAANAKLVVHPNAKVIVNGGTLTNLVQGCGSSNYWPGVEVWGQSTQKQIPSQQGTLELKNGAIIEHAGSGVRLGHLVSTGPWTYDWGKTGGIVKATTNSIFRNNRKDVEFLSYQNYYLSGLTQVPKKNVSFFNDTEFLVDEVLPTVTNLSQRVSLYDVDGIRFLSCNFHIEGDALTNYAIQNRGIGIYSLASSFVVNGRCVGLIPLGSECDPGYLTAETLGEPNSDIIPSRFSNYLLAIRSIGADGFSNTSVKATIFTDNQFGIFLKAIEDASIYRNKFNIVEQNFFLPISYGVSLLGCDGYEVERNIFKGTGDLTELNTGLWITDSPDVSNEIYLNDFDGLYAGSLAQGIQAGDNFNLQGLEMLCGLYENTKYNLAVQKYGIQLGQIGLRQGDQAEFATDVTAPAGNLFTQTDWGITEPFTDYFICPDGECGPIIYEHHNQASAWRVVPVQIDDELVELSPNEPEFTTRQAACPVGHGIVHTPSHLHSLVVAKRLEIEAIEGELEGLIDGGNTATVQTIISNANNSSANVRSNLLPLTPYLSDDVLHDLILRQPAMNPWHLCEILIACSPLSPTIFDEVDNSNQLSEFLFGLLTAYQIGTNGFVSKETQLKQRELEKANALSSFIRTRISDDDENYFLEEVKELMTGDEINREIKKKVAIYRQENNHAAAAALLADYDEDPAKDVWKQVMTVLLSIDAAGGYGAATPSHIAALETLALSGKEGSHHASALLEILTGVQPDEELNLPNGGLKSLKVKDTVRRPSLVGVYPNPAKGEFYITYVLPTERESASINIYDLQGKLVHSENITVGYGILSLNAKQFATGSYVFELELNGQKVATEKFQIVE